MDRRDLLVGSLAALPFSAAAKQQDDLRNKLGIVTASLTPHIPGKLSLLDFPQFMNGELGLEVIDLNTMNFPEFEPAYLDRLRANIAKHGCIATNLKMNQKVDMASRDPEERKAAIKIYKQSIDAASHLGCRWVRPLPRSITPDLKILRNSFYELIDYADARNIGVLVENFGWMMNDADSVISVVNSIGKDRVAVGIDTGNWADNRRRYTALERTFPLAVTCDFKAKEMTADFVHPGYDLKKCFDIGWDAGFRGPWCLEHGNRDIEKAKKELLYLKKKLSGWIAERSLQIAE